ncbi:pantoate--beta-alanine ligase [Alphaproteobacteria bacterium]|nr:pantoate--beta-alanine ligase [Alphaproteobacteria bacterium]
MDIVRTVAELRSHVSAWRKDGLSISLIPTMGSLHAGHLSLMKVGREKSDKVIASIFVNPLQFAPNEDFETYPREENFDILKLVEEGVDLLFAPKVNEMYREKSKTTINVGGLTDCLCALSRPGFFDGVATVVTKLLLQALPDIAIFGEKDYQQLLVIKRFTTDLDIPVEIIGAPTIREDDGLALSSRNIYLDTKSRSIAPSMYSILNQHASNISNGSDIKKSLEIARKNLQDSGFEKIDYLDLRNSQTLETCGDLKQPSRLFAAAWLGSTRLIDNLAIN